MTKGGKKHFLVEGQNRCFATKKEKESLAASILPPEVQMILI
jgi:hypothetical protein